jgi:septal ring factor EnvC (AmiA/AmiB activator)
MPEPAERASIRSGGPAAPRGGSPPPRRAAVALLALGVWSLAALTSVPPAAQADPSSAERRQGRLQSIRGEIVRLEGEVAELRAREQGVLGELERLGAELRLAEKESEEVSLRLEEVGAAIKKRTASLEELERAQEKRRSYLAFRLREIYKDGPEQALRRFIGGAEVESYWSGLRYATYLSERDGKILDEYRAGALRLTEERAALVERRGDLRRLDAELDESQRRMRATRGRRTRLLRQIRDDQERREVAIGELRSAADALGQLVESLRPGETEPLIDVSKFRGLLDWPAEGEISAGFGTMIHPRFKTRIPHPGLDIEGDFSSPIRTVFDGRVVFAAWMRGYGLTAIVDHGHGLLSIYAHASVLLVESGQAVTRGQSLGRVGDTGSLRGPYLYFELRLDGKPEDPDGWLRPRRP